MTDSESIKYTVELGLTGGWSTIYKERKVGFLLEFSWSLLPKAVAGLNTFFGRCLVKCSAFER